MNIDGSQKLKDQESAIQFMEGQGNQLTDYKADTAHPPVNVATFKGLPPGQRPKRIHLLRADAPGPPNVEWKDQIYIEGILTQAKGYRS